LRLFERHRHRWYGRFSDAGLGKENAAYNPEGHRGRYRPAKSCHYPPIALAPGCCLRRYRDRSIKKCCIRVWHGRLSVISQHAPQFAFLRDDRLAGSTGRNMRLQRLAFRSSAINLQFMVSILFSV
jgi:hypothetical protein